MGAKVRNALYCVAYAIGKLEKRLGSFLIAAVLVPEAGFYGISGLGRHILV
jgi:hypothetical protein